MSQECKPHENYTFCYILMSYLFSIGKTGGPPYDLQLSYTNLKPKPHFPPWEQGPSSPLCSQARIARTAREHKAFIVWKMASNQIDMQNKYRCSCYYIQLAQSKYKGNHKGCRVVESPMKFWVESRPHESRISQAPKRGPARFNDVHIKFRFVIVLKRISPCKFVGGVDDAVKHALC